MQPLDIQHRREKSQTISCTLSGKDNITRGTWHILEGFLHYFESLLLGSARN